MKFVTKYWKQISTVLTILAGLLGWCWRLAGRIEDNVAKIQQFEQRVAELEKKSKENNGTLTEEDRRIFRLELIEELREKKLLQ